MFHFKGLLKITIMAKTRGLKVSTTQLSNQLNFEYLNSQPRLFLLHSNCSMLVKWVDNFDTVLQKTPFVI